MSKIILINPYQSNKYPQILMGLLSLGTMLNNAGYKADIYDCNIEIGNIPFDYDIYGISIVSPAYINAQLLISQIKSKNSDARIIVGGAHPSALPEQTLSELNVDTVVVGEGELSIFDALKHKGIINRNDLLDLDALAFPDYSLLKLDKYHPHPPHGRKLPFMPILTSRGCSFHCCFCSKSVFGNKYRTHSADYVVSLLEYLQNKLSIKEVAFYDDVFTLDKHRVYQICELINKRNIKLIWSCETRVDLVDYDLMKAMKEAGCFSISFGIESGNRAILDYIDKNIEYEQVYEAVKDAQKLKLETVGYFMFVPDLETPQSIRETIDLSKELNMDYVQFSKMVKLPGSKAYNNTRSFEGYSLQKDDAIIKQAYKEYYLRLNYIIKSGLKAVRSIDDFKLAIRGFSMFMDNATK